MKKNLKNSYDIVIVGGGVVGLSALIILAEKGWRVALVEKNSPPVDKNENDLPQKVLALNPDSRELLLKAKVWQDILAEKKWNAPFETMKIYDDSCGEDLTLDSALLAKPALGWIVEQSSILSALYQRAASLAAQNKCDIFYGYTPQTLRKTEAEDYFWCLDCATDNSQTVEKYLTLKSDLIIAADGANSSVRQQLKIKINKYDYRQHGLVCVIKHDLPHNYQAQQVFLETGPLAFLPLADPHYSSIVWSMPSADAKKYQQQDEMIFSNNLTNAFSCRLGFCQLQGSRFSFPLGSQQAENYVAPHALLLGDAAHQVHPLAGQGANLGFADVAALSYHLDQAKAKAKSASSVRYLRAYERQRRAENQEMQWVMDLVKEGFSAQSPWWVVLRRLGLSFAKKSKYAKKFFMHFAA